MNCVPYLYFFMSFLYVLFVHLNAMELIWHGTNVEFVHLIASCEFHCSIIGSLQQISAEKLSNAGVKKDN